MENIPRDFIEGYEHTPCPSPPTNELESPTFDRRRMLRGLCLAAGMLLTPPSVFIRAIQLDTEAERLFDQEPVLIEVVDKTAEQYLPGIATFVVPGFNVGAPVELAHTLVPALKDFGSVIATGYGEQDFDDESYTDQVVAYAVRHNIHSASVYGHSMGGMVSLTLARKLQDAGIYVPLVYLNSTPDDSYDVKNWGDMIRSPIPEILLKANLSGGVLTRTAINYSQAVTAAEKAFFEQASELMRSNVMPSRRGLTASAAKGQMLCDVWADTIAQIGLPDLKQAFQNATSRHNLPDEVCISQLTFIADAPASSYIARLDRYTTIDYIGTARPEQDTTVNVGSAIPKIRAACMCNGNPFIAQLSPLIDHADPGNHQHIYADFVYAAARRAGLTSIQDVQLRYTTHGTERPR